MKSRRNNAEEQIQAALVQHLQLRGAKDLLFWHTPNGGRRSVIEGAKFKRLGVLAGVSDLLLMRAGNFYALEIKAPGNRPTELQDEFLDRFRTAGGLGFWVASLDEGLAVLQSWGLING